MGGILPQIGWGMMLSLVFVLGIFVVIQRAVTAATDGPQASPSAERDENGDYVPRSHLITRALVSGVSSSGTIGGTPQYTVGYTFELAVEGEIHGGSMILGEPPVEGTRVPVIYNPSNPSENWLKGWSPGEHDRKARRAALHQDLNAPSGSSPVGPLIWLGPLLGGGIPGLIGLVFVIVGLRKGARTAYLLANGRRTTGTFSGLEGTNVRINNQPVFRLYYDFETDEGTQQRATCTMRAYSASDVQSQAAPEEVVLYDPSNPARAIAVQNLPGGAGFDETGRVKDVSAIPVLVLPGVVGLALAAMTVVAFGLR